MHGDEETTPQAEQSVDTMPPDRRRFLTLLSAGLGGIAALVAGIPFVGFLLSPLRRPAHHPWRPVGAVNDFPLGQTRIVAYIDPEPLPWAGYAAQSAAWVRRETETEFVAFSPYCTHTGCPVTWAEGAQLFMCPCHGGTFHRDGQVAAGPPPRPLDRLEVRVRNGQVEVRPLGVPIVTDGAG